MSGQPPARTADGLAMRARVAGSVHPAESHETAPAGIPNRVGDPGSAPRHQGLEHPIRVAMYMKGFPPSETGGPVLVAYNLAQEFLRTGTITVTLIVQTDAEELDIRKALGEPKELTVVRLGYFPSLNDIMAFPKVIRALRAADLIHFHEFPMRQIAYVILAKARGVPMVFSLHGLLSQEAPIFLGPDYPLRLLAGRGKAEVRAPRFLVSWLLRVYRRIAPLWTAVVASSKAHLTRAAQLEDFDPSRIRLIPNGVEVASRPPMPAERHDGRTRLLFVGKLERIKGPDLLLAALERLRQQGIGVDASFIGGGSLEGELRRQAEGLEGHRVTFHGPLPHEVLASFYEWSDIVVVPSRYESFGIVVLEAMAAGRPLVATAVGGIPEIVSSPRNAILVTPDPESIARGIRKLIEEPDLRTAIAEANLGDVRPYYWPQIAPKYLSMYEDLLRARASG